MEIRKAGIADCLAIAELAQIAGNDIPGFFWADARQPGQSLETTGAELLKSETANFSYRNTLVACQDDEIAGMLIAYRLPEVEDNDEDLLNFPEFVRPLIELEQCVAGSFYINMLATYPRFRGQGIGSALMAEAEALAAPCELISIAVFASNPEALALYQQLGYETVEQRAVIACDYHPATEVLLLTKAVAAASPT
ncbi:MAG: GNAT family N-acetyltransferase [Gammaproteobacteria bacterium]|nr:GNAT family N-acetyltransferase [Gammaproteobacteria bacterium]